MDTHMASSYAILMMLQGLIAMLMISGKLIMSRYIAESITTDAGRFGRVGLCQLRTKLRIQQCETSYKAVVGSATYLLTISSPSITNVATYEPL